MTGHHGVYHRLARGVVVILAAAAATTWLQTGAVAFLRHVLGVFSWKWWLADQLFLTSVGYLALFAVAGLGPMVGHLLWPRRYGLGALAGTLAGLAAFCVLMVFERISWLAWLVVAGGIGVHVHRALAARPTAAWRGIWRVALFGHVATVVAVVGTDLSRRWTATHVLAALPDARPDAPNVLLIVVDTERAGSMSLYGAPDATTPYQEALGRQGVVFSAAYTTAPWTLPAHASLFTGRYASQTSADHLAVLDDAHPTLAEAFRDAGYFTTGLVANVSYTGAHTGLARGFTAYRDSRRSVRQILLSTTLTQSGSAMNALAVWDESRWLGGAVRSLWPPVLRHPTTALQDDLATAEQLTSDFLAGLPAARERPFFAFLNLFDVHSPYLPPPAYRTRFDSTGRPLGRYQGAIRYVDDVLESLVRGLELRGELENTIVAVTADHGELFGEHGRRGHGNDLYLPVLHVPLLVLNAPGAVPGTRVAQRVSLRDLAATLLDLAAVPNTAGIGGTSLRPLLEGAASQPTASPVLAELTAHDRNSLRHSRVPASLVALIDDSSHVIASATGLVRVFALPGDTAEVNDLSGVAALRAAAVDRLQRTMAAQGIRWPEGEDR